MYTYYTIWIRYQVRVRHCHWLVHSLPCQVHKERRVCSLPACDQVLRSCGVRVRRVHAFVVVIARSVVLRIAARWVGLLRKVRVPRAVFVRGVQYKSLLKSHADRRAWLRVGTLERKPIAAIACRIAQRHCFAVGDGLCCAASNPSGVWTRINLPTRVKVRPWRPSGSDLSWRIALVEIIVAAVVPGVSVEVTQVRIKASPPRRARVVVIPEVPWSIEHCDEPSE